MRTVSLRRRVVASGLVVTALVLGALDLFLYLSLRSALQGNVRERLDDRAQLVAALSGDLPPSALAERLSRSAVPATVRMADGRVVTTSSGAVADESLSRTVPLPDGGTVEVFASMSEVDHTMSRLLRLELLGTATALVVVVVVANRVAGIALEPLAHVVATARRIAAGQRQVRFRPADTRTDVGQMAAAFDEMLDALEAAVADARASSEFNQRFLSDVAHQLRTPITGIRASAETLAMGAKPAVQERLLANLVAESERAGRLLTALLRMARIDQGEAPDRRPSDLVGLCRAEVERARALAPELRVLLDVDGQTADPLELDPASMREVLSNLLDNARRHAVTRIGVTVRQHDDTVEVRVADDGSGMSDEAAERAFERFVSLDACGGSGLGLPIARGIVRAHGGDLTYERKTFVVRLPARVPAAADPPAPTDDDPTPAADEAESGRQPSARNT